MYFNTEKQSGIEAKRNVIADLSSCDSVALCLRRRLPSVSISLLKRRCL